MKPRDLPAKVPRGMSDPQPATRLSRRLGTGDAVAIGLGAMLGALAVLAGLWLSLEADTPAGPSVVAGACVLFVLCHGAAALRRR